MIPEHTLTFGVLNLIGTDADLTTQGWRIGPLADDFTFGSPDQVRRTVESWLQDGVLTETEGYGNRELVIPLLVEGETSDYIAQAEMALMAEVARPNQVTWSPPDGEGATCVFEVFTSELDPVFDDEEELRVEGAFNLRLTAYPSVRSTDEVSVTVAAPTVAQTITTVDNCSSVTGWSALVAVDDGAPPLTPPTPVTAAGRVNASKTFTPAGLSYGTISATRSGLSASVTSTPYLRIEIQGFTAGYAHFEKWSYPSGPDWYFIINGIGVPVAVQDGSVYWLDLTGTGISTVNTVKANASFIATGVGSATVSVSVGDISRSNVLGDQNSTNRQINRTLPVAGSVRTQGTIQISDAASALGVTLVHTMPAAPGLVQPNLRRYLSSGNTPTPDASTISGVTSDLTAVHAFDVPATGLLAGAHELILRVKDSTGGSARQINWAARARQGGANLDGPQLGVIFANLPANVWTYVSLDILDLPPRALGANGLVRIEIQGQSGMLIDDAWIFNIDDGHLTRIDAGANKYLWIDSPTPADPVFRYFLGPDSDRANSYEAGPEISARGDHELMPPEVNVFTITTGSLASVVNLRHYRRFHTRVVKLPPP